MTETFTTSSGVQFQVNITLIEPIDWIKEARNRGFVSGAVVRNFDDIRVIPERLGTDSKGNVFTRESKPFFIRLGGKWRVELMKTK